MELTAVIDAGNENVKYASRLGLGSFNSLIGEYRELKVGEIDKENDIVFEYNGRKGFVGDLAKRESEFCTSMMGDSKNHEDAKLRILIALHRIPAPVTVFNLIVGQPIGRHTPEEKEAIKKMLLGSHRISVNGVLKLFRVASVNVAAEGGSAFWSNPTGGEIHIIDAGSGTINCATIREQRFIDRDSRTLKFGMNTIKTHDMAEIARYIAAETSKKWRNDAAIYTVGGVAIELAEFLRPYYPNIQPWQPLFQGQPVDPLFANVAGFYKIGEMLYDND